MPQEQVGSEDHLREQWMNVQPIVMNSIVSLQTQGKATSQQVSDLAESLEQLHVDVIEKELRATLNRIHHEYVHQDQFHLKFQALNEDKAEISRVEALEDKFDRLSLQLASVTSQIQDHAHRLNLAESSVLELGARLNDKIEHSCLDFRCYVDEQVSKIQTMVDIQFQGLQKQIQENCEQSQETDAALRTLSGKVQNMGTNMKRLVSSDELEKISANKASTHDVDQIREQLSTRVTQVEFNHELTQQTKPLHTALAALEKAVQIQDYTSLEVKNLINAVGTTSTTNASSSSTDNSDFPDSFSGKEMQRVLLDERLFKTVNEALEKRALEDEIDMNIDKRMTKLKSFVVHEMNDMVDAMRVETASVHREQLLAVQKHADLKIADHIQYVEDSRQMIMKLRDSIQELAQCTSSALAKKADSTELDSAREDLMSKMKEDALEKFAEFNTTMNALSDVEVKRKERSCITSEKYKGILVATEKMKIQLNEVTSKHEEEINSLKKSFLEYKLRHKEYHGKHGAVHSDNDDINNCSDWRTAVGRLTAVVRNGLDERPDREELFTAIRRYVKVEEDKSLSTGSISRRLEKVESDIKEVAKEQKVMKIRLYWSSGGTDNIRGRVVSWDVLGFNTYPAYIKWKRNKPSIIHIKASGLYRVSLAVFTRGEVTIDIQLNGNTVLMKKSESSSASLMSRPKHVCGDVTCVSLEEYVSLPPECDLMVRIVSETPDDSSKTPVQAFIEVTKS